MRSLNTTQVFDLGFEGIAPSKRHKSGVAVRFPRMLRRRRDKPIAESDTLDALQALLTAGGEGKGRGCRKLSLRAKRSNPGNVAQRLLDRCDAPLLAIDERRAPRLSPASGSATSAGSLS